MEQESEQVKTAGAHVTLDEKAWRENILAADAFAGSNLEYCKRHGLTLSRFRKWKRKLGMSVIRGRPKKAFIRVESAAERAPERAETHQTVCQCMPSRLPDPRWMAEFVAAFLDAR